MVGAGPRPSTAQRGPQGACCFKVWGIRPGTSAGSQGQSGWGEIVDAFPLILQSLRIPPCLAPLFLLNPLSHPQDSHGTCHISTSPALSYPPMSDPHHLGVAPIHLGNKVPQQCLVGTLVVRRCRFYVFPLHQLLYIGGGLVAKSCPTLVTP